MAVALPTIGDIAGVLPSTTDLLQGALLSLGVGMLTAGFKAKAADGTLDPLGLHQHVTAQAQANPTLASTLTMAAFITLPPATQQALVAAGVKISG